jgi:hypothetical protein
VPTILRHTLGAGLICLLASLGTALPVFASSSAPRAQVVPSKVSIRGEATVIASHLQPGTTVTLLFAVPDLATHRVERLLGATHADAHGRVRVTVSIPLVTTCGPASLYVISAQTAQHLRARFTLTGCKATKQGGIPPPPPGPHKP